jgi:DinB superfamily
VTDEGQPLLGGRCPGCGLDLDSMQPPDTVVTAKSLPRRWRGALAPASKDEDLEAMLRRRPRPGTWSALEHACRVVAVLRLLEGHVRRAATADSPVLEPAGVAPAEVGATCQGRSPDQVLDDLTSAADAMAATLGRVPPDGWLRPATLGDAPTDVRGLARAAAHEGTHHLREAERVLREVRGRPD